MQSSRRGATLIELVAILFAVMIVVALLLPALRPARRNSNPMENGTRIRGIHQGMVTFANSNKGHFPGLTGDPANPFTHANDIKYWDKGGEAAGSYVGARYAILLEGNFFTPDYLISPYEEISNDLVELDLSESNPLIQEPTANLGQGIGPFNYSYALLEIHDTSAETPTPNGAAVEWRDTLNSQAVVAGDRNIGKDSAANIQSIHTTSPGEWEGNVVWNDNHVNFEQSPVMDVSKFGQNIYKDDGSTPIADHLFTNDDAGNDAKLNIKGGAGK